MKTELVSVGACLALIWSAVSTAAEAVPFANYTRFVPTGPTTLNALFESGPFPEKLGGFEPAGLPLPGWDEHVEATIVAEGDPQTFDAATMIVNVPIFDTLTAIARDADGNELGRLVTLAVGDQKIDLNAANAIVDNAAATIQVQFGGSILDSQPAFALSVTEATGIYQSDVVLVGDAFAHAGGHLLLPLDDNPSTSLQDNILNAYTAGEIIGVDVIGVYTGTYVPEPSAGLLMATGALLLVRRRGNDSRRPTTT